MEAVIGERRVQGRTEYLIKWKDFPESEATWEDHEHLNNVKPLITRYRQQNRKIGRKETNQNNHDALAIKQEISYDTPPFTQAAQEQHSNRHSSRASAKEDPPKSSIRAGNVFVRDR